MRHIIGLPLRAIEAIKDGKQKWQGMRGRVLLAGQDAPHRRATMTEQEEQDLQIALAQLKEEHRDLDTAILAIEQTPSPDHLQIKRLKKRKLYLRDRIREIDDQLFPDIIA